MTILESILSFTGTSIASGITWDILKNGGQKIINAFKKKFIDNKSFDNESECESFLHSIVSKQPNSKKNPYRDLESVYEDSVNSPKQDFIELFRIWISENIQEFQQIKNNNAQHVSVKIKHQENNGSGTIINAGIINNN